MSDVFPRRIPDLYVGRPVLLTGRFDGSARAAVRVRGRAGGRSMELGLGAERERTDAPATALPSVWARLKIADLTDRLLVRRDPDLEDEIRQVALDYQLVSAYTAFVAVDATRQTDGEGGTRVPVVVPMPEGVKYETTVPDD